MNTRLKLAGAFPLDPNKKPLFCVFCHIYNDLEEQELIFSFFSETQAQVDAPAFPTVEEDFFSTKFWNAEIIILSLGLLMGKASQFLINIQHYPDIGGAWSEAQILGLVTQKLWK